MGPTCKLNALVNKIPYTASIDMCMVEGVQGGTRWVDAMKLCRQSILSAAGLLANISLTRQACGCLRTPCPLLVYVDHAMASAGSLQGVPAAQHVLTHAAAAACAVSNAANAGCLA